MDINAKLERSKSDEEIDFAAIACLAIPDPLITLQATERIALEPIWFNNQDTEGQLYRQYIVSHPTYDTIYIRSELQNRLQQAADFLPNRYQLIVRAGHRPLQVQQRLLQLVLQEYRQSHPMADVQTALDHARLYVSDPAIKLPPHCCGAALDIDMFDLDTNKLVDFGGPVNLMSEISHLHSVNITNKQRQNRLLLLTAMLNAGFASYHPEWWHFSYGDQVWAWFYGQPKCLYGLQDI